MALAETVFHQAQEYAQTVWDDTQLGLGTAYNSLTERMGGAGKGRVWLMGALAVNAIAVRAGLPLLEGVDDHLAVSALPVQDTPVELVSYMQDPVPPTDDPVPTDSPGLERGQGDPIPVPPPPETGAPATDSGGRFLDWFFGPDGPQTPGSPVPELTPEPTPTPELPNPDPDADVPVAPSLSPFPEIPDPNPDDVVITTVPPPVTGAPDPNVTDEPSGPEAPADDTPSSNEIFNSPPLTGEYLWDYMDRIGVPPGQIMPTIHEAVDDLRAAGGHDIEWHGSNELNQWLEIDGQSDTPALWRHLRPYFELK